MMLADSSKRLLAIAETLYRWLGALAALDEGRRTKLADYADKVAATLARAAAALARMAENPKAVDAEREAIREFGRIAGYIETIVGVLQHHLDGRKLAGVKRRLEVLQTSGQPFEQNPVPDPKLVGRLVAAEGYFRALADGLRA
jgi:hypothetical protein